MLKTAVAADGGWESASPQTIAEALRGFELKRAPRCHDMVQLARSNGAMMCAKRSWLVRCCSTPDVPHPPSTVVVDLNTAPWSKWFIIAFSQGFPASCRLVRFVSAPMFSVEYIC